MCALEIVKSIECWNQQHNPFNESAVRIAVGIHYGEVVQGNVGGEKPHPSHLGRGRREYRKPR